MNYEVWYSTKESEETARSSRELVGRLGSPSYRGMLCFTHAVQAAINGEHVRQHVVDSDNYYTCDKC